MPLKADTEAYLCNYSSCPTLVFYRLEKVFLHESRIKLIFNQFDEKLTLHQVHSCFLKLFEINIIPSHSNQPSSFPLELIDRFLYEAKIYFSLIKIQLYKAKMSVIRSRKMKMSESDLGRLQHLRWSSLWQLLKNIRC